MHLAVAIEQHLSIRILTRTLEAVLSVGMLVYISQPILGYRDKWPEGSNFLG